MSLPAVAITLNAREVVRLDDAEQVIERGLHTFVEVGTALADIRDGRLYRESHGTFEAYCEQRWGLSRSHAYRLMEAAETVGAMSPIGDTPQPATESQARELSGLSPDAAATIMQAAHETSGGQLTASVIREARQHHEPEPPAVDNKTQPEPKAPKRKPLPDQARTAGWELRKSVERLERIAADDRFTPNKEQMASHLRGHLTHAVQVCQDLLARIDTN